MEFGISGDAAPLCILAIWRRPQNLHRKYFWHGGKQIRGFPNLAAIRVGGALSGAGARTGRDLIAEEQYA